MADRVGPHKDAGYPTLLDACATFDTTLLAKSPRTAANYRSAFTRLCAFLRARGHDPAVMTSDQLPATLLEDFYVWLLSTLGRDHRRTALTYVAGARAFLAFLDRREWLQPGLSYERMKAGLRALIGATPNPTPQVGDAVALVVSYVNSLPVPPSSTNGQLRLALLRDKALLTALYATALRRAELAGLNRTDVQDGRQPNAVVTGKGGKQRVVFFDEPSLAAIRTYIQARGDTYLPLFIRHDDARGKPGARGEHYRLSPHGVWEVVKRYGALAGVDVTTHHLRHLRARVLLNAGMPLSALQDVLGHASPETTKRIYAAYSTATLRAEYDRYSVPAEEIARRVRADQDTEATSSPHDS